MPSIFGLYPYRSPRGSRELSWANIGPGGLINKGARGDEWVGGNQKPPYASPPVTYRETQRVIDWVISVRKRRF